MDYSQLNLLFGRGLIFGVQMLASLVPVPSGWRERVSFAESSPVSSQKYNQRL